MSLQQNFQEISGKLAKLMPSYGQTEGGVYAFNALGGEFISKAQEIGVTPDTSKAQPNLSEMKELVLAFNDVINKAELNDQALTSAVQQVANVLVVNGITPK
ncbi:MAG: hypothetical protein NZ828_04435 [Alphaproteobacteria bacterium]|nr:hypothetical protein [Alphaproteobacteria bacterium]